MAKIVPFRGILYNTAKVGDLSGIATPPFDVISEEEQDGFHQRHPNNMIRLILGKPKDSDSEADNPHTRSAEYFRQWLADGILLRDDEPAFYLTETGFHCSTGLNACASGQDLVFFRYGIIGAVELVPFDQGIVLPHEKTFSGVKTERLSLMKACHTNYSPVFSLFSDSDNLIPRLKQSISGIAPVSFFIDDAGMTYKLWRITDPLMIAAITQTMEDKRIYIADGHHRYETALNYKYWTAEHQPDFDQDHPANFVMMYLTCMEDPGLVILPAHRLLKGLSSQDLDHLIHRLPEHFEVQTVKSQPDGEFQFPAGLSASDRTVIGLFMKNHPDFYWLKLKPNVMESLFDQELPGSLADLDVTVLTRLIFMELLGFDQARLDNDKLIGYTTVMPKAVEQVRQGKYDAAFMLNPTKIEQVRRVADAGQIMPRKSTYFFPKVITGQVINYLRRD